ERFEIVERQCDGRSRAREGALALVQKSVGRRPRTPDIGTCGNVGNSTRRLAFALRSRGYDRCADGQRETDDCNLPHLQHCCTLRRPQGLAESPILGDLTIAWIRGRNSLTSLEARRLALPCRLLCRMC